jgi:hypothetical protein
MDPDPAVFFKTQTKNYFSAFYLEGTVHFHPKIKSHEDVTKE